MTFSPSKILAYPLTLKSAVDNHIFRTYRYLRLGIATLAVVLPASLWIAGGILGIPFQDTMSHYYYDSDLTRNLFVGILWTMGSFLVLYAGINKWEDLLLNLAGVCAVGVAMVPTLVKCKPHCPIISWHHAFTVTVFLSIAGVCYFAYKRASNKYYKGLYLTFSLFMIGGPAAAFLMTTLLNMPQRVFMAEAVAFFGFAAYWYTQTLELWKIETTLRPVPAT